jgi:hypothetical protein
MYLGYPSVTMLLIGEIGKDAETIPIAIGTA